MAGRTGTGPSGIRAGWWGRPLVVNRTHLPVSADDQRRGEEIDHDCAITTMAGPGAGRGAARRRHPLRLAAPRRGWRRLSAGHGDICLAKADGALWAERHR